jgi:hypothetical protein
MIAPAPRNRCGDDLCGDPRGIRADYLVAARQEVVEPVRADDREECRANAYEQMRTQAGLALAQLALEADRAPEHGRKPKTEKVVVPAERRDRTKQRLPRARLAAPP